MEEAQENQLNIQIQETKQTSLEFHGDGNINSNKTSSKLKQRKRWFHLAIFSILVLCGQLTATLLGRLYYEKGGKSKYMAALVQCAGFPILLPLLCVTSRKNPMTDTNLSMKLSLAALYIIFGTFLALICLLYAVGLKNLPASTFSLICASQLEGKYVLGFICTLSGAAGYALQLSLAQRAYGKVLKRQTIKEILNVIFYESLVTTCTLLVGLFVSGEWKTLKAEMHEFQLGKKSYVMILVWTALAWQVFSIGLVALILKVSSLFANVVSTVNVPAIPILAVVVFQEKMTGIKVVAMILAIWGSISYVYQQYLDDAKSKEENKIPHQENETFTA
ncbi:purine permease 21-like isoform X3 [Henckelia pumila]|uniref:purine permease 21-like isoform X3 n=1 Tax=Henckelia pumila TaxID=405737 RepID=UPI003C6E26CA